MRAGLLFLVSLVGCTDATMGPTTYAIAEVEVWTAIAQCDDSCDPYVVALLNGEDRGATPTHNGVSNTTWRLDLALAEGDELELHLYDANETTPDTLILPCYWSMNAALLETPSLRCTDTWSTLEVRLTQLRF